MYIPDQILLKKYADVLVKFALWSGEGIRKGDVVSVVISESAKPFLLPLQQSILEAGGHMILTYAPDGISKSFYEQATDEQLQFYPKNYMLERVKVCDHQIGIISEADKHELEGIDSKKILERSKGAKFYMDARRDKENAGKFTWTLALYGTEAMAKEVGMTEEEYWDQIIKACYLDVADPVAKWKQLFVDLENDKAKLNDMKIEKVHIKGDDIDLEVKLGAHRLWMGGSGRNIPSFELFISPDWRGTNGWVKFNQPLYRYGNLVTSIEIKFKDGLVVEARADKNEQLLKDMIAVEGANKIGEFSLTDKRFSRITKFMAETLFDENVGGEYGNTHIALGMSYHDSYDGDMSKMTDTDWEELGYNDSVVHTDIISTSNRVVTATLADGSEKIIYRDGMFQL